MKWIFNYRNYLLIGGIFLFGLIVFLFFFVPKENSVAFEPLEEIVEEESLKEEVTFYKVDIKGAVERPGVYSLEEGSRVNDAILEAGGMTSQADSSSINLSKKIEDEMVIFVAIKKEESELVLEDNQVPSVTNGAAYHYNQENSSHKVSLNHASLEELMELSGIGNSKAQAIISYRTEKGGFQTIEEIMEVKGIGEGLFAKIKEDITL